MSEIESKALELYFHPAIAEINSQEWNHLSGTSNPFIRHEFLAALETHQCVGQDYGWFPYHLSVRDHNKTLIGACPLYIKTNSYGEFVFDWSWASAYERAGLDYYPKMVCSSPYNPVTGPRLLAQSDEVKSVMIQQIIKVADKLNMSGMHWLFTSEEDTQLCRTNGLQLRLGCQYHWSNRNYSDFDEFLATFISRKRKKVKRERRMVEEQNIHIDIIHGNQASEAQVNLAHQFYTNTFDRKSGIPTLSANFFQEICQTMGEQVVFMFAVQDQEYIACAITFKGSETLYGRFWGCKQEYHSLHFETCFYQGIDYCIKHKLNTFEPGAQGEHKITRGFLPTKTWSAHWIKESQFQQAIYAFCEKEQAAMLEQCDELHSLSPFKTEE